MKKHDTRNAETGVSQLAGAKLTRVRAEKMSAIEGLHLTPRMDAVLRETTGLSGDERRAAIKALFSRKTP